MDIFDQSSFTVNYPAMYGVYCAYGRSMIMIRRFVLAALIVAAFALFGVNPKALHQNAGRAINAPGIRCVD
jgi:hypothetical protein